MTPLLLLSTLSAAAPGDLPDAKVVMPWNEFKTLYEQGKAPEKLPPPAPRDWSINTASYSGVVTDDGSAAVFDVDLQVQVHKVDGWVTVPLAPASVGLKSAKIGREDAPIFISGGWYTLVTDRSDTFTVSMELATSVFESDGSNSLSFQMAPSGGTQVSLDVPGGQDLSFSVGQAQLVTDVERNGMRHMEAILPATGNLAVSWQREIEEVEGVEQEGRAYAEVHSLVGVSEGVIMGHSDVNYTIVHQGVEQLLVELPANVVLLDVSGSGIREWDSQTTGDVQLVTVDLNFEALGSYRLMLDYERALAEGGESLSVPTVGVKNVERVKGFVGVAALSTLEVTSGEVNGARRVDVRELPASILGRTDQPVLLGYKYRQADYTLPLTVRQHEDVDVLVTIADTAEAISMVTADGRVMNRVTWHVRNNRRQFLRLEMPEGAEIWSAKVAGKAVKPAVDENGMVLVPLVRSQASGGALAAFTVELVYVEKGQEPTEQGEASVDLVLPKVDVPVTYYRWSVYVPWEAKVKKRETVSSLRQVEWFNVPVTPEGEYLGASAQQDMQMNYQAQNAATQGGVAPVEISMPVDGQALMFEKLLVLDEEVSVHVSLKKLKD